MPPQAPPIERQTPVEKQQTILLSELIAALSYGLDLTEGQPLGHSARACILGMRIGREIGIPAVLGQADAAGLDTAADSGDLGDLYYALLLKDAGCSSNASRLFHILSADEIRAKRDVKTTDWTRVGWESLQYAISHVATGQPLLERLRTLFQVALNQQRDSRDLVKIRCERGSAIARRLGFAEPVAEGIFSLDEHWNGGGYPNGLRGREIPLFSRIMNLAQTLEVFLIQHGPEAAIEAVRRRSRRWFDPDLVHAAEMLHRGGHLFAGLDSARSVEDVAALEPEARRLEATAEMIDNVCIAFADIIDAKSPFTYRHSSGVAQAAIAIGQSLELPQAELRFLCRAALLHDIGKLAVPNSILEKPGSLTSGEFEVVKTHPAYTFQVLHRIPIFSELSEVAASHHEKLDGSGYFRGYTESELSLHSRILVVADIYDALSAKRPYRDSMPAEKVFALLQSDAPNKLDRRCVDALKLQLDVLHPDAASRGLMKLFETVGLSQPVEVGTNPQLAAAESHPERDLSVLR